MITDLAHFRDLDVIARNSAEAYKGKAVDVRQVGKATRASRYVLEGSIQREADRVRVTAQLIDARTDAHVWSERWDRPAGRRVRRAEGGRPRRSRPALGGDLTMGQITRAELQRAKRKRPKDLGAYDHFLLGKEGESRHDEGVDPRRDRRAVEGGDARSASLPAPTR